MTAIRARLDELLLLRATQALTDVQHSELEALLAAVGAEDAEAYERAAAAIHVGTLRTLGGMPPALRARIEQQALRYLRTLDPSKPDDNPEP